MGGDMNIIEEYKIREEGLRTMKALFRFVKSEKRDELRQLIEQEEKIVLALHSQIISNSPQNPTQEKP